jgi:hypothetical protein
MQNSKLILYCFIIIIYSTYSLLLDNNYNFTNSTSNEASIHLRGSITTINSTVITTLNDSDDISFKISIQIISAKELLNSDLFNNPSDPYVEVYFNYDLIHVTNYISNNNNPVWNEEIINFNIMKNVNISNCILEFYVYDYDYILDDLLGYKSFSDRNFLDFINYFDDENNINEYLHQNQIEIIQKPNILSNIIHNEGKIIFRLYIYNYK